MKRNLIIHILLTIVITSFCLAQDNTRPGAIGGKVIDAETQRPLSGARIILLNSKKGSITNKNGEYLIDSVPTGRYVLSAIFTGYKALTESDVIVVPARTTRHDFLLEVKSYETSGVEVVSDQFDKSLTPSAGSSTAINNSEIRMTPGIPDLFRRLQSVAGVGKTDESSAALSARGGDPEENLTLVENIEIYSPLHFASLSGENVGGMSIIEPKLVEEVSLSTGGFSSEYGDRLSSVNSITLKEPEKRRVNGDISLDMGGLTGYLSGPLTSNASWMVSARRGIMDLMMKLADLDFTTRSWDFHSKFVWEPNAENRISLYGLYSDDNIAGSNREEDAAGTEFYSDMKKSQSAMGINWRWLFSANGYLLVTPYYSSSEWKLMTGPEDKKDAFGGGNKEDYFGVKAKTFYRIDENNKLSFGLEAKRIDAQYYKWTDYDTLSSGGIVPPYDISFSPDPTYKVSTFVDYELNPIKRIEFRAGLRQDYFDYNKETTLDPRISARFEISELLNVNLSWGVYSQFPQFYKIFYAPENKNLKAAKAIHYVAGAEYLLSENTQVKAEVYYKSLSKLPVTDSDTGKIYRNTGAGFATGIELTLTRRMNDNLYLLANYTYAISKRKDADAGKYYFFKFDRPHAANLMATYKAGDWWEFGLSCNFASGAPFTPYDLSTLRQEGDRWYADKGVKNSARYPDYFRIDLRADRRFIFDSWNLRAYLEIWNITNHENVFEYQYSKDFREIEKEVLFPFTPMIGIAAEF